VGGRAPLHRSQQQVGRAVAFRMHGEPVDGYDLEAVIDDADRVLSRADRTPARRARGAYLP
jgi:TPP-dependent pyruvate/acetoin dehydrogenase alpha subunit